MHCEIILKIRTLQIGIALNSNACNLTDEAIEKHAKMLLKGEAVD
jgi:hypothetical protein